jgi:hypothetical protein
MTPAARANPRAPVALLVAVMITAAANVVLWRWPARAGTAAVNAVPAARSHRVARLPPPQWTVASGGQAPCAQFTGDRARELSRLEGEVLRRLPYEEHYRAGQPSDRATRWFDSRLSPRLSAPPPEVTVASDCRGEICRVEVSAPSGDHTRYGPWLSQAVGGYDVSLEPGDRQARVRYIRVPSDETADGQEILARFSASYSWDDLLGKCEREGPVAPLGVRFSIRQYGVGDAFFEVTLLDRQGRTVPESTPARACITWTLLEALQRIDLPPSPTRATRRHFLEVPAQAAGPGR